MKITTFSTDKAHNDYHYSAYRAQMRRERIHARLTVASLVFIAVASVFVIVAELMLPVA